jgi:hypothetical protein
LWPGSRDRSLILATVLCVGVSFLGYDLVVAADSGLGKGTPGRGLWGRKQGPAARERSRH